MKKNLYKVLASTSIVAVASVASITPASFAAETNADIDSVVITKNGINYEVSKTNYIEALAEDWVHASDVTYVAIGNKYYERKLYVDYIAESDNKDTAIQQAIAELLNNPDKAIDITPIKAKIGKNGVEEVEPEIEVNPTEELRILSFKGDYVLEEEFDFEILSFTNTEGEIITVDKEDIQITGFDSSQYQMNQEVTITVNNWSKTILVNVLPAAPNKLIVDDSLDTIFGLNNTMEYKTEGSDKWIEFDGSNLPNLSGNNVILVRYSATTEQPYSHSKYLNFTESYFLLEDVAKNGEPTNTLTFVWNVDQLNESTFNTLKAKSMNDLFAINQDILNVFGNEDIKIINLEWDNSGDKLKSTFTLAKPINMKETLGVSFQLEGLEELDYWVGYQYIALYKASDSELFELLQKEIVSEEISSKGNITEILKYMSSDRNLITDYNINFESNYIAELSPSLTNIVDLQNIINRVNNKLENDNDQTEPTQEESDKADIDAVKAALEELAFYNVTTTDTALPTVEDTKGTKIDWSITDESGNPIANVSASGGKVIVDNSEAPVQVTGAKLVANISKGLATPDTVIFRFDINVDYTAPTLNGVEGLEAGSVAGTTRITTLPSLPPGSDHFEYKVSVDSNPVTTPNVGDVFGGTTFSAGEDITVANGTHIGIAAVDTEGKVVQFVDVISVTNLANVASEAELTEALANSDVANINLAANITLANKVEADYLQLNRAVTIDGQDYSINKGIAIEASNVIIKNLEITPSEFYADWYYGIMVGDVTGVEIIDSTITGPTGLDAVGISDKTGSQATEFSVTGTTISDGWMGIIVDSPNTTAALTNNILSDEKYAIYLAQADLSKVTVTRNTISSPKDLSTGDPGYGITLPAGTLTETKTAIQSGNTFTTVTSENEVVIDGDQTTPTAPAVNDIAFTLNTADVAGGATANGSVAVANVAAGATVTVYAADGTTELGTATNSGTEAATVTVEALEITAETNYQVSVTVGGVESTKTTKQSQAIDLVSVTYDNGTLATKTDDTFTLKFSSNVTDAGAATDFTITFDNANTTYTDADISLIATEDYTVSVLNNEVVITLTESGLAKIDETGEFDNGSFKIVVIGSNLTPVIDGVQSFEGTLANSQIIAVD